jgi:purine-binding chemotaxis protein CheW
MSSEERGAQAGASAASGEAGSLLAFADTLLAQGQRQTVDAPTEIRQYVTFFLRETEYGIPILQCREIVRLAAVTRVPEAPAQVRGVVNLRGHIVPAVDTRQTLGLASASPTARSRLIVVEVAGRLFALIVDRVARILKLATSEIAPPAERAAPPAVTGVAHVGEGAVFIMDAEALLRAGLTAPAPTTRGEEA